MPSVPESDLAGGTSFSGVTSWMDPSVPTWISFIRFRRVIKRREPGARPKPAFLSSFERTSRVVPFGGEPFAVKRLMMVRSSS